MFTTQHSKLSNDEKAKLMSDVPKMKNMVDQVAQYLADSLQIRDERIGEHPLVEISRQEILHFPTQQRKTEMEELVKAYEFVAHSEDLSDRMYTHARRGAGGNVSVESFLHEEAYYLDDEVTKEGPTPTSVPVGGIGDKIMNDVSSMSMEWLDKLDKVLCEAASIQCSEAATIGLSDIKKKLAVAIAERLSVMGSVDMSEDRLSSRSLGEMIEEENKRSVSHGEAMQRIDIRALRTLSIIATNPTGDESRKALESELPLLNYVAKTPPQELVRTRTPLKLFQLARALVPDLDIEVRVALATFWADNNGKSVAFAVVEAISKIEDWMPCSNSFTSVVRESARSPSALTIPEMKFLHTEKRVATKGHPFKRSGLDERGDRTVRLIRCVWELASKGVFSSGVVASEVLAAVATEGVLLGRMAANMLNNALNVNNKGFKLSTFLTYLYDMEGEHVAELDKAACALSSFSCSELEFAFDSEGQILPVVCASLTKRTQDKMTYKVESGYTSFATDALAFMLPIIEIRRNRVGVPRMCRTSAIADILATLPRVRAWNPQFGTLRLDLEALRVGHRNLRKLLDNLAEEGVLVHRKGSPNKTILFEFDTPLLYRIMSNRVVA